MSEYEIRERLTRLEASIGDDSGSGIRRELAETKDAVRLLFDRLRAIEFRLYTLFGGGLVAVWILERVWK